MPKAKSNSSLKKSGNSRQGGRVVPISFIDESNSIDRSLEAIASMIEAMSGLNDPEALIFETIAEFINTQVNKSRLIRHFFLDEPIPPYVDDEAIEVELSRLEFRYGPPPRKVNLKNKKRGNAK
jgi:hypothetical protein